MKKTNKRKNVILTIALMALMMFLFSGCASKANTTTKEEAKAPNENVVETKVEEKEETAEVAPEAATESETEVSSEPIVYEGIDYESTLPGVEWIETFVGIIDEPKFVVFNDETNKKVIVEDGQIINRETNDIIAVYLPDGVRYITSGGVIVTVMNDYEHSGVFVQFDREFLEKENKRLKKTGGAKFYVKLDNNGEEQQLNCIISLAE